MRDSTNTDHDIAPPTATLTQAARVLQTRLVTAKSANNYTLEGIGQPLGASKRSIHNHISKGTGLETFIRILRLCKRLGVDTVDLASYNGDDSVP